MRVIFIFFTLILFNYTYSQINVFDAITEEKLSGSVLDANGHFISSFRDFDQSFIGEVVLQAEDYHSLTFKVINSVVETKFFLTPLLSIKKLDKSYFIIRDEKNNLLIDTIICHGHPSAIFRKGFSYQTSVIDLNYKGYDSKTLVFEDRQWDEKFVNTVYLTPNTGKSSFNKIGKLFYYDILPFSLRNNQFECIDEMQSIRVGTDCNCTQCNSVQVMSVNTYVAKGLDQEMYASWNNEALKSGAIAYRTNGIYFKSNPVSTTYDIASSSCNQNWQSNWYISCQNATDATNGKILVDKFDGSYRKSEYATENNNAGCGDGFAGTGSTYPCIADTVCVGETFLGHGRGMCLWGAQRWALNGQSYDWILDHYYDPGDLILCDNSSTGRLSLTRQESIDIYPNPISSGRLSITINRELTLPFKVRFFDNLGRIMLEDFANSYDYDIDIAKLNVGSYIIEIYNEKTIYRTTLVID